MNPAPAVGMAIPERQHYCDEVQQMLYNASLWNGHRIHFDMPYATEVEGYLPAAPGAAGFFEFVPSDKETPAIRAGTIPKYRFWMPGSCGRTFIRWLGFSPGCT